MLIEHHLLTCKTVPCARSLTLCVLRPTYPVTENTGGFTERGYQTEGSWSAYQKPQSLPRLFIIFILCKKGKFSELFSSCTQSYNFNAFHIHAENLQSRKNESNINFSKSSFSRGYVHCMRKL